MTGEDTDLPRLSAEEQIKRGQCPVKPQWVRQNVVRVPAGDAAKEQPKSKKKGQTRKAQICISFSVGKCHFGAKCKYSHDVEAYLRDKPADLPGACPFTCTAACPFGMTCRWASAHKHTDPLSDVMAEAKARIAAAAASQPGAPGTSAEGATPAHGASTDAVPQPAVQVSSDSDHGGSSKGTALAVPAFVELPVADRIEPTINSMAKDVQQDLWKRRYDFSRADAVLTGLGIRISQHGKGKGGKGKGQGAAAPGAASGGEAAALASGGAEAVAAVPTAGTSEDAVGQEPQRKRQKLPDSGDGTAPPTATAAGAGADAEPGTRTAESLTSAPLAPSGPGAEPSAMYTESVLQPGEKKIFDVRGKTYLAPLTTVGNLPFRRVCKKLGADITCGEMALASNLLQGQAAEWALLKRHPCEDFFGVQVCGGFADSLTRAAQLIDDHITVDFVDINMGCPIDLVCDKSAGSSLLLRPKRIEEIARSVSRVLTCPLTLKTRKGYYDNADVTHTFVSDIRSWGPVALTLHGRTRQQRYSRQADWAYIQQCAELAEPTGLQLIGNGDIYSYEDWNEHAECGHLSSCMIGRGALIKPWLFTEIKEQRHWDISSSERLDILKTFVSAGLEHWGSDTRGVENTRRFLLEWLSYLHRYVPVGLLEVVPNKLHWRPPAIIGRDDLETLMASDNAADWVRISEMLLGPVPPGFTFQPKHKSNSYAPVGGAIASSAPPAGGAGIEEDQEQG